MKLIRNRYGFTLVELLVVSALFLLFFSMIASASRPNAASQVRQLSQDLASVILATQTLAITSESGAGLTIRVNTAVGSGTAVLSALSPPYIRGKVIAGSFFPTNSSDLSDCYAVQFLAGDEYGAPISPWLAFTGSAALDSTLNQTPSNTVLPSLSSGTLGFVMKRRPLSSGLGDIPAVQIRGGATLDLRYSGLGNDPSSTAFRFSPVPSSISLGFDRTGSLNTILTQTGSSLPAVAALAPVYLLITSATAGTPSSASLASQTSRWIALSPNTGRVTVAANVSVSGTTNVDIRNARENARRDISRGAR